MKKYKSFAEFYPFYLSQHSNAVCRQLHFWGSLSALAILIGCLATKQWQWLWLALVVGYGFAWVGHYFYEKNRPATFTYPLYSFIADWVLLKDMLTGKIK